MKLADVLEKPLDQREQPPLFEADVRLEQLAELSHDAGELPAGGEDLLEPGSQRVQALVFEQRLHEQLARLLELDHARKQQLLLVAEVRDGFAGEEAQERRRRRR